MLMLRQKREEERLPSLAIAQLRVKKCGEMATGRSVAKIDCKTTANCEARLSISRTLSKPLSLSALISIHIYTDSSTYSQICTCICKFVQILNTPTSFITQV